MNKLDMFLNTSFDSTAVCKLRQLGVPAASVDSDHSSSAMRWIARSSAHRLRTVGLG